MWLYTQFWYSLYDRTVLGFVNKLLQKSRQYFLVGWNYHFSIKKFKSVFVENVVLTFLCDVTLQVAMCIRLLSQISIVEKVKSLGIQLFLQLLCYNQSWDHLRNQKVCVPNTGLLNDRYTVFTLSSMKNTSIVVDSLITVFANARILLQNYDLYMGTIYFAKFWFSLDLLTAGNSVHCVAKYGHQAVQ